MKKGINDTQLKDLTQLRDKTIRDFGEQWSTYRDNEGYYGSAELFTDIVTPLLDPKELKGCRVADIGSGTGRIVNMLLKLGVERVIALEPSIAFNVLRQSLSDPDRVLCLNLTGDKLPRYGNLDYVFSIGVLHHIPDPAPVVEAAREALRDGGRFVIWVYGKEGNRIFLFFCNTLRLFSKRLPHLLLVVMVWLLDLLLVLYMKLCFHLPLPLQKYMLDVLNKLPASKRRLVIYDQLNPAYAKYYTRFEAERLLIREGFTNVQSSNRHGYSWTIMGTKP